MIRSKIPLMLLAGALSLEAQRQIDVKGSAGFTGFADEGIENHLLLGASSRLYLTRRLSVEPEILYLRGSRTHHDLVFAPAVVWDFGGQRIVPYALGSIGIMRSSFSGFSSTEGFISVGGGVKFYLDERWFVAPEVRIGWQPHIRISAGLGYSWR